MLLRGQFVIRYADIPRQGPEPDGDTIKFKPDTPGLVETLPRRSGRPPGIKARGISVRLEAIDALETHFEDTHQELTGANEARNELLKRLGFTHVEFYRDLPNKVERADQDKLVGYVLSNGIDANGRMIGFVFPGDPPAADGSSIFLDNNGVDRSVNAQLLADGLVYPAFYSTLPATLRTHLAKSSRAARSAKAGIWARATADPNGKATATDLTELEILVLWPKLFRRIVPYFAAGHTTFDMFDTWLRADAVHRDDRLLLLSDPVEPGNMHDIISAASQQVQLIRWPEDIVIEPDPPTPSTTSHPAVTALGTWSSLPLSPIQPAQAPSTNRPA
jgi:endonuclease YncB( thermonuclease family)